MSLLKKSEIKKLVKAQGLKASNEFLEESEKKTKQQILDECEKAKTEGLTKI